jgi:UDP-N-acetylmuramate dehydrogenase
MNDLKKYLMTYPGVICDENIDAHNLTSFCIGGKVNYLITISNPDSVSNVIREIAKRGLPIMPLGAGTNMLVSDDGYSGVFLKLDDHFCKVERTSETSIQARGGLKLNELISYLLKNKLSGLTFLSGIPGTVGGAVAMNAGAFGDEIRNHIINVHAVTMDGDELHLKNNECEFEYRQSIFLKKKIMVLTANINVTPGESIEKEVEEYLAHRKKRHTPKGRYAGSVFKNPEGNYAGKILDESGMRGMRIGGAYVSEKHANFILADEDASADDVLELMKIAALRAYSFYGIKLYPEIKLVGFDLEWNEIFEI